MPSNQTTNYQLSQWVKSDKVLMDDFNDDNRKIDAAIKAVDNRLSAMDSDKVSTSALDALKQTVTTQGTALELRNCRFVTGTYTGSGGCGVSKPNTLNFDYKPVFVCVTSPEQSATFRAVRDQTKIPSLLGTVLTTQVATWGSKSLSWYNLEDLTVADASKQLNTNGKTYYYFAILEL